MIQIKNVSFSYAGSSRNVLDNFSLNIGENRICGLLGKNGTGKSTLLYLMSGLLHPTKGLITVNDMDTRRRYPDMLREIFIVPEEYDLPNTSLEEYVAINETFYPRFSREVLKRCLDDFELSSDLKLGALSMGQKKKVYMSMAMAAGTQLLFMDEPSNGLDIPSKSQFRKVVAGNMSDDRTIIISTHQVHDVESLLDHVIIIDQKGIALNSSIADISDRYVFETRQPGALDNDVVYSEFSMQGVSVMAKRGDKEETPVNLELLFGAAVKGLLK